LRRTGCWLSKRWKPPARAGGWQIAGCERANRGRPANRRAAGGRATRD
jgi:hypothetical protein